MRKGSAILWLVLGLAAAGVAVVFWQRFLGGKSISTPVSPSESKIEMVDYESKDLQITLKYPKGWYLDEKGREILVSSYKTHIGEARVPGQGDLKVFIGNASLCQKTLDQEVLLGGCGEGINTKNEILSKVTKDFPGGSLVTYKIKYPTGKLDTWYYFQNGLKFLQISKQPDPNQHEAEFEAIVESIRFL